MNMPATTEIVEPAMACHVNFPRYLVSDQGEIISLVHSRPRKLKCGRRGEYIGATILNRLGELEGVYLHTVVAETFHGARPAGQEVRHRDGIKENCAAENLCWGTRSQNMRDKERHGTAPIGERSPQAKLDERTVKLLRRLHRYRDQIPIALILRRFQISRMQHWRIVNRKAWSHVA